MLSPEERLCDAIKEGNYPGAYAILRKLEKPLEGEAAAKCVIASFSRTDKLFFEVLEHLSPEVRGTTVSVENTEEDGAGMLVCGTLLVLAAALGTGEHVKALLARGFDANAATLGSACSDFDACVARAVLGPEFRRCAAPGNMVMVSRPGEKPVFINGCTPLAAAIAAGNAFTCDVLLQTPGVWKTESSAVCRAAALHAEGKSHRRNWVLSWDGSENVCGPEEIDLTRTFGDLGGVLFPRVNMQPGCFADFCSLELLKQQYESGACTDGDARAVLASLLDAIDVPFDVSGRDSVGEQFRSIAAKLLLTAKFFPKACRERGARARFLRAYLKTYFHHRPQAALLKCWKMLSGPDRDISDCAVPIFCQSVSASELIRAGKALENCLAGMPMAFGESTVLAVRENGGYTAAVQVKGTYGNAE